MAALLGGDAAEQAGPADVTAWLAALRGWDPAAAAALAAALARRAQGAPLPWPELGAGAPAPPARDADKAAAACASARHVLLGSRAAGLAALAEGWAEARDAVPGATAALGRLRRGAELAAVCWSGDAAASGRRLRRTLLWADAWRPDAPARAALAAWLDGAGDAPRRLLCAAATGRVAPCGALLVLPADEGDAQAHCAGAQRTLRLPPACATAKDVAAALRHVLGQEDE
jgi:hypothetical protein